MANDQRAAYCIGETNGIRGSQRLGMGRMGKSHGGPLSHIEPWRNLKDDGKSGVQLSFDVDDSIFSKLKMDNSDLTVTTVQWDPSI